MTIFARMQHFMTICCVASVTWLPCRQQCATKGFWRPRNLFPVFSTIFLKYKRNFITRLKLITMLEKFLKPIQQYTSQSNMCFTFYCRRFLMKRNCQWIATQKQNLLLLIRFEKQLSIVFEKSRKACLDNHLQNLFSSNLTDEKLNVFMKNLNCFT
jgi:hypothetical protein